MPKKVFKPLWVPANIHQKARLLSALLEITITEAVDIALTKMLEEIQETEKKEKPKPRSKK